MKHFNGQRQTANDGGASTITACRIGADALAGNQISPARVGQCPGIS
jgi:hypothetical protein